jgi:hypothetical protein
MVALTERPPFGWFCVVTQLNQTRTPFFNDLNCAKDSVRYHDGASLHVARSNELEKQMGFRPGRSFYFHHEREHD